MRTAMLNAGMADNTTMVHYYKEGCGIMFDDTFLHEVHNYNKKGVRIVLFLDVLRKLPWFADLYNRFVNFLLNHFSPHISEIRKRAILKTAADSPPMDAAILTTSKW